MRFQEVGDPMPFVTSAHIPTHNAYIGFDLAATFPKYINIRRGAYITVLLSIACNPWKLVSTATIFLSVLSSYAVFLGPMTGLMISSWFVVNKRKIKVEDLYTGSRTSIYWCTMGVDWRAAVAVSTTSLFTSGETTRHVF